MRIQMAVASALLAPATAQAPPPPVLLEPLAGRQVFPLSNWWNQDISTAPVDPRSAQLIGWISGRTTAGSTAVRRLHPEFGPPPYGIPYVVVAGSQPGFLSRLVTTMKVIPLSPDCRDIRFPMKPGRRRTISKEDSPEVGRRATAICS